MTVEEIEAYARQILLPSVEVQVTPGSEPSHLVMTLTRRSEVVLQAGIMATVAQTNPPSAGAIAAARGRTVEQVTEAVNSFKQDEVERVISELGMEAYLKDKYADKNVIYKVPRHYTTRRSPAATYTTNLDHHYLERVRMLVPHFQPFWEFLVMNEGCHQNRTALMEYAHGLMTRLGELAFSLDTIRTLDGLKPDNDIHFLVNYHLTQFISLVKSIGDNLAWLLTTFYDIKLADEKKTDLLFESYLEKVREKDAHLHARFSGQPQLAIYENLKLFMDIVQHRHALHVTHIQLVPSGEEHLYVPVKPSSGAFGEFPFPVLASASDKASMASVGMKQLVVKAGPTDTPGYERLEPFCKRHLEAISYLCDQAFARLNQRLRREPVGKVYNFLSRLGVALISLFRDLEVGPRLLIEGNITSMELQLDSMQVEHKQVQKATAGQQVGIKVPSRVRAHDVVYRINN